MLKTVSCHASTTLQYRSQRQHNLLDNDITVIRISRHNARQSPNTSPPPPTSRSRLIIALSQHRSHFPPAPHFPNNASEHSPDLTPSLSTFDCFARKEPTPFFHSSHQPETVLPAFASRAFKHAVSLEVTARCISASQIGLLSRPPSPSATIYEQPSVEGLL